MIIIAHRGNDDDLNENRLKGLLSCLSKNYIDGVELDIKMTKDYKFILSHSNYLRTKDRIYSIEDHSLKFLKKKMFMKNSREYPVVELKKFLDCVDSTKIIMLELKVDNKEYLWYKNINKILKKYSYLNLWICSFNDKILPYFKKRYKIGLLKTRILNQMKKDDFYDFVSVNYKGKIDKPYFLWTINKKIEFPKDRYFIGIITDKPKIFAQKKYE